MIRRMYIQLIMPWEVAAAYLEPKVVRLVSPLVNPRRPRMAWIESDAEDPRLEALVEANQIVAGESLIRSIETKTTMEEGDIRDCGVYVLQSAVSRPALALCSEMGEYFRLHIHCRACGRSDWEQTRDYELADPMRLDLERLDTFDLVVSRKLKEALERERLRGFQFRPAGGAVIAWQLASCGSVPVKRPQPTIVERELCSACGRPRLVYDEDSNGVYLLKPHDRPYVSQTPTLYVTQMRSDFGRTDQEFGTVGSWPEGAPPLERPEELTHCKMSWPKWVVSGRFAKVLFRENVGGFELEPAEIVE
jgi:hypothetical protein